MLVVLHLDHSTALFLGADLGSEDPFVVHNLVQSCALFRVNLEHSPDDMPTFTRKKAQQAPRALDHGGLVVSAGIRILRS